MMKVVFPHIVEPFLDGVHFPCRYPLHRNMDHIVDEHAEDEERITERDDWTMIRPIPFHGETGKCESQEGRPPVSKKNDGRLTPSKIVGKKSDPCPDDRDGEPAQSRLIRFKRHRAHESSDENGKPRGQPIHAVEKIEGVRDPDDPEQRQHDIRHIADWAAWKQRQNLARRDDDSCRRQLSDQLGRMQAVPTHRR